MIQIENAFGGFDSYPDSFETAIENYFEEVDLEYNKVLDNKTGNVTFKVIN